MKLITLILGTLLFLPCHTIIAASEEPPLTLLPQQNSGAQSTPSQLQIPADTGGQLNDIYGPVSYSEPFPFLYLFGIIIVAAILIAALLWYLKREKTITIPAIPPWDKAMEELKEARKLLNPQQSLHYMERMSQILRGYIESRFTIQTTKQTTVEFLRELDTSKRSPLQSYKADLQRCLEQADMAKFAHHGAGIKELTLIEESVHHFISQTTPQPESKGGKR